MKPVAGDFFCRRPLAAGTLAELEAGDQATVARVGSIGQGVERLMEMGMVPGTAVDVVRAGGRHLLVRLRGFTLGLGRHEARHIEVVSALRSS